LSSLLALLGGQFLIADSLLLSSLSFLGQFFFSGDGAGLVLGLGKLLLFLELFLGLFGIGCNFFPLLS
jgi:hypothetical protein